MACDGSRGETDKGSIAEPLLRAGDPLPVEVVNPGGRAPVLIVCEHAGRAVPSAIGSLGISEADFADHIAWDIGASAVAHRLSESLDAPLVLQAYSRLVVDCNRPCDAPDCFPDVSDTVPIPANRAVSRADLLARYAAVHQPFHETIAGILDERGANMSLLLPVHSFAPRLRSDARQRPWEIGLLYNRDGRFAHRLMTALRMLRPSIVAAFNEPYTVADTSDYTIPVHGEGRGLEHVLIELRNSLIRDAEGQRGWADLLAAAVSHALAERAAAGRSAELQ